MILGPPVLHRIERAPIRAGGVEPVLRHLDALAALRLVEVGEVARGVVGDVGGADAGLRDRLGEAVEVPLRRRLRGVEVAGPRLPPELRLQELRIVRDVPEVAGEEVHLRDAGVGVARELREVEERDLAVLLPPGVALLPELLAALPLLLGHPRALREIPLLEEVAHRPAVRGEPLQLLLARRRGGRRRARRGRRDGHGRRGRRPELQGLSTSQHGHPPVIPRSSSGSGPVQVRQAPKAERSTARLFGTAVVASSSPSISSDTQPWKPALRRIPAIRG